MSFFGAMRFLLVMLSAISIARISFGQGLSQPVASKQSDAAAEGNAEERRRQDEVTAIARAKSKMLRVIVRGSQPVTAKLSEEPLLRWSNPTIGSIYGEVFLWTLNQRPVALASIYRWYHPFHDSTVEIVSLSEAAIEAKEGDTTQWKSQSPGVSFQTIANAPLPATSDSARLSQMRTIARRFTVELHDRRGGESVVRQLRLLMQPVYRYENPQIGIHDGALFAFVEVTDPEAWLIIEAAKQGDDLRWRYSLARMNIDAMQVRHDGKLVQTWPEIRDAWNDRNATYTLFGFDPQLVRVDTPASREP
jgi:hypothetical protein